MDEKIELELPQDETNAEASAEAATEQNDTAAGDTDAIAALTKERDSLKAELAELNDKYLRMAAEYENFRRRSRDEKEGTYSSALADTVKELLPIIDNLERAAGFDDGEKVKQGLQMIYQTTDAALAKLGVETFGQTGDKFDPNLHNAIMHEEDDSGREDEITDVFQKGYRKGDRIIRFAMVKTVN